MLVVVTAVANGVEAVIIGDVEPIAKVDYISDAFTCDTLYFIAWETKCEMICDCLRHYYIAYCRCWSWSFYCCGFGLCFRHCVG